MGTQCEETGTWLNKNNRKRAYQMVKDIISEKQGSLSYLDELVFTLTDFARAEHVFQHYLLPYTKLFTATAFYTPV